MKKGDNSLNITKSILVFCIVLILFILVSCSKTANNNKAEYISKNSVNEKAFVDKSISTSNLKDKHKEKINESLNSNHNSSEEFKYEDLSDIKNVYYGKYNVDGEDVLGNFQVTRNSIVFTPDNGHSKEVIYFTGMKNIDRFDHPNGKIDLSIQFNNGHEKIIRNVSDSMFSDILLYTTK